MTELCKRGDFYRSLFPLLFGYNVFFFGVCRRTFWKTSFQIGIHRDNKRTDSKLPSRLYASKRRSLAHFSFCPSKNPRRISELKCESSKGINEILHSNPPRNFLKSQQVHRSPVELPRPPMALSSHRTTASLGTIGVIRFVRARVPRGIIDCIVRAPFILCHCLLCLRVFFFVIDLHCCNVAHFLLSQIIA